MAKKSNGGWYVERDQENSYDRVRWLNLMISEPYYLFHLLVFFTYIPVRISAFQILSPARNSFLLKREIQVFVAYCVLTIVKIVRTESWESFIQDILLFAKIFLTAIALVLDYHLSLCRCIGVSLAVIHIIAQQPPYEGLGTLAAPVVWFTLLRKASCEGTFVSYSFLCIRYSNANLSFGTVDLGLFPNAAEKFGIPFGSLNQLPVYILFENATEVARFPGFDSEPYVFGPTITKSYPVFVTGGTGLVNNPNKCIGTFLQVKHERYLIPPFCFVWAFVLPTPIEGDVIFILIHSVSEDANRFCFLTLPVKTRGKHVKGAGSAI
ncbi:putative peptide transporter-like [Capsicum annuum]|nr:putative peptide transporter-like [Capsicum annuum]